ncbi:glycosyltransferase [Cellulomonas massiliensis]|uniref:glycosyltransferase n=1 Tax=Cellulomonas massiliensis TaxID=1465811 RepID=UPI0003127445|nr:glycosyltransferase [Cellulomonas massiliensis]
MSRSRTDLYFLVNRFSADSGGRTRSAFVRAAALAGVYRSSTLLTLNFRTDYHDVVEAWRLRLGLPANVTVRNIHEWMADEPVFAPAAPVRFRPPEGARKVRREDAVHWEVRDEGVLTDRYLVEGGVLQRSLHWEGGVRVRAVTYDDRGAARLVTHYRPGAAEPHLRTFTTAAGRTYLEHDPAADAWRVLEGPRATDGFVPVAEVGRRWVAALQAASQDCVLLVEDRRMDPLVLDNPHLSPQTRSVATIHSVHLAPPYDDPDVVGGLNARALERADEFSRVVILTREQRRDVERHFGPRPNLVTIGSPVAAPSRRGVPLRTRLGELARRPAHVVVVTRLSPHKRVDHTVRAFALVVARVPWARLHLWGDGESRPELERLVQELGLTRTVTFHGHTTDPLGAYRRARVAVSTSQSEGHSLTMLESLAQATPYVTYGYRYGPRDTIRDGWDGYVVPVDDVEALADAVVRVLTHPWRARLMGLVATRVRWTSSPRRWKRRWVQVVDGTAPGRR